MGVGRRIGGAGTDVSVALLRVQPARD